MTTQSLFLLLYFISVCLIVGFLLEDESKEKFKWNFRMQVTAVIGAIFAPVTLLLMLGGILRNIYLYLSRMID